MTDFLIDFFYDVNMDQMMLIGIMLYIFYNRLNKKMLEIRNDNTLVKEKIENLDKRLCRIEGALASISMEEY